jgi:hypothetical protein
VLCGLLGCFFIQNTEPVKADLLTFTVTGGSLTLSGNSTVSGSGVPGGGTVGPLAYTPQLGFPDSLVTSYGGFFVVDVNNVLAPTALEFDRGQIDANVRGPYSPNNAGTGQTPAAPADYGFRVAELGANGKLRDVVFGLTGASTPVTGGTFSVANQNWAYNSGFVDVFSTALNAGTSQSLLGTALNTNAGLGSYNVAGNTITMTLPVTFSIAYTYTGTETLPTLTGVNTYTGTITAVTAVPEPTSLLLCGLVGFGAIAFRGRMRKLNMYSHQL